MRIAYINKDEVNRELASRMAAKHSAAVCSRLGNDPPRDGEFDAVNYNLHDVARDLRATLVERLCRGAPDQPAAVHGYDITDHQLQVLRQNGIAAARRIDADLVRSVCKAARRRKRAALANNAETELTWVNVV